MRFLIYISLLVVAIASGQPFTVGDPAFAGAAAWRWPAAGVSDPWQDYITNVAGLVTWYPVDGNFYSSGSTARLTNKCSVVSSYSGKSLSVDGSGNIPALQSDDLNGLDTLKWDGTDDVLAADWYTNTQPHMLWFVVKIWETANNNEIFFSENTYGATASQAFYGKFDGTHRLGAGATFDTPANTPPVNKWHVLSILLNGASSEIKTNNVLLASGSAGNNGINGIKLGPEGYPLQIAEFATFTNALDATASSNVFRYFTNKYAIGL